MLGLYVIDAKHRYALVNEFGLEQCASEGSASNRWTNVSKQRFNWFNMPRFWQHAEWGLDEPMPMWIAKLAGFVDAAGEEILEEALLDLFELSGEEIRRSDRVIHRIQSVRYPPLGGQRWEVHRKATEYAH